MPGFRYESKWYPRAQGAIDKAFARAYNEKAVSQLDYDDLDARYQKIQVCMTLIRTTDSKVHKEKLLPGLIKDFERDYGFKILF